MKQFLPLKILKTSSLTLLGSTFVWRVSLLLASACLSSCSEKNWPPLAVRQWWRCCGVSPHRSAQQNWPKRAICSPPCSSPKFSSHWKAAQNAGYWPTNRRFPGSLHQCSTANHWYLQLTGTLSPPTQLLHIQVLCGLKIEITITIRVCRWGHWLHHLLPHRPKWEKNYCGEVECHDLFFLLVKWTSNWRDGHRDMRQVFSLYIVSLSFIIIISDFISVYPFWVFFYSPHIQCTPLHKLWAGFSFLATNLT